MEYHISDLPEGILIIILSFLTLRDAARTSVLSRSWRNLWKFVDILNLDDVNRLGPLRHDLSCIRTRERRFVEWVDHVIDLYQGSSLRHLKIHYRLGLGFPRHIDRWIAFAIAKKVTHLELNFLSYGQYYGGVSDIFPCLTFKQASTSVQHLSLTGCRLNPSSLDQFKSLRSLYVASGYLTDEILERFLSNCLFLENLSVCWSTRLVNPKIAGSCLKLKFLEICNCFSLKSLEIYAADLKSLKYNGQKILFNLRSTPKLVNVKLSVFPDKCNDRVGYALDQLNSNFLRLETMALEISPNEVQVNSFPTLSNLKVLILLVPDEKRDFCVFASLLRLSPSLHRFELQINHSEKHKAIETEEKICILECHHKFLKEFEVVGFRGYQNDMELIMYVVRNATALKKVTLDPYDKSWDGTRKMYNREELCAMRDRARKFRNHVNRNIEVVIR